MDRNEINAKLQEAMETAMHQMIDVDVKLEPPCEGAVVDWAAENEIAWNSPKDSNIGFFRVTSPASSQIVRVLFLWERGRDA